MYYYLNPLNELRRDMGRWLDTEATWAPSFDVEEQDGHWLLSVDLPGASREQLKVEAQEDVLTISGERRRFGKFQRAFTLPAGSDAAGIEANYQDGVLSVYVPKAESAKPREIKIAEGPSPGFLSRFLGSPKKALEAERAVS